MEDWAEIRRLHRAGKMPIKVIVRTVGCSKNTARKALQGTAPPKYVMVSSYATRHLDGQVGDQLVRMFRTRGWTGA